MIPEGRIQFINDNPVARGRYVLYWMQQSQRAEYNHALEYAAYRANELGLPLVACFGLTSGFPEGQERHYRFMLEGLSETARSLEKRGIRFIVRIGEPDAVAVEIAGDAALAVTDRGYLRVQKAWRERAARGMRCPLIQVESDVIVPVEEASPKEEFTAGTFRPKILRRLDEYILPLKIRKLKKDSLSLSLFSEKADDIDGLLGKIDVARDVKGVSWLRGGTSEAKRLLKEFIARRLQRVPEERNDPSKDCVSRLSPYLHFGQVSPLFIAMEVREHPSPGADIFLEELIVRRELAMNFVHYNERYDSYECLHAWSIKSLEEHAGDPRENIYSLKDLEAGKTHDPYWNAAQREMVLRGHMHGYMRMYWGKKILEWSPSPREAYRRAVYLNNKYELDGRDPNGFAGVAWCFGKHDRAWGARPVFGKVRYMNDAGLRRKFDIEEYVRRVESYVG
jgi:deoxyribodipyrimidine photo-lyase